MTISIKTYEALTKNELYKLLQLRSEVFVVEQDCVYQDIDGLDEKAIHVLGFKQQHLVAYTRIFKPGDYFKEAGIGRVVVKKEEREFGYGKDIMLAATNYINNTLNCNSIELSAQVYLKKFYNELGFIEKGETYLEDGIPHIKMTQETKD